MPQIVYFFPLDAELNESGESIPVSLRSDGTADISKLPQDVQDRLTTFGLPDPTHATMLHPKDGEAFLEALIDASNLYWRFRERPEPRTRL